MQRFTEREREKEKKKVPGYPQRRTKAPCTTRREALLTRGIACLQEQPQEFEDCTTLTIASPPHHPNPVFSLFCPRKEKKKKRICSSSFFPLWITHPFPLSLSLKSLFVHSSPCHLSSYSPPSLILTHKLACLPTSSPRNFSFFSLTMRVCQPFALTIKIPPVPVISRAWQPARGSVFVEICRSTVFFFFFLYFWRPCLHRQTLGKCDQGAMYTGKNGEGDGWEEKKGVEMTHDAFLCTFVIQTGRDAQGEGWFFSLFFIKETVGKTPPVYTSFWGRAAGGSFAGQKLVTRCTWERKAF